MQNNQEYVGLEEQQQIKSQEGKKTIPKTDERQQDQRSDLRKTNKKIIQILVPQQNQKQQQQTESQQAQQPLQEAKEQQQQYLQEQNEQFQLMEQLRKSSKSRIPISQNQKECSLIIFNSSDKLQNQDPMRASQQRDNFQTEFRDLFLRLDHEKQLINPLQLVINKNINIDNMEVLFYVLSDQMKQSGRVFYQSLQPHERLMYSFHGQFTADSEYSQAYCLTLQETPSFQYKYLVADKFHRNEFVNFIQKCLSIDLQVQEKQIQIIALEEGSVKVIFQVIDPLGTVHVGENLEELKKLFPGSKPSLQLHNFFETALLSVKDFDYKHNMTWNHFTFGRYDNRGPKDKPQPYFFPIGWKGYALNVAEKYGENTDWLMMNGNKDEWYVMFHGTSFRGVKGIMSEGSNLTPGGAQVYKNDDCLITKDENNNPVKIGKGVYFSNHIEISGNYSLSRGQGSNVATSISDKKFMVAFQSRVRPGALRQCRKTADAVLNNKIAEHKKDNPSYNKSLDNMDLWNNEYFVVNKSEDIRPYRILLKQIN